MRSEIPRGGVLNNQTAVNLTTASQDILTAKIDVPAGCIAIVTGGGLMVPTGNTLAASLAVDGAVTGPTPSSSAVYTFFSQITVPSGRHKIALTASASSAAGAIQNASLSWTIVQSDGRR